MPLTPSRFSALYYPYSRCLRETDLKRMLLIFDQICSVDPLSKDLAHWPGQYPVYNQAMHIRIMQDSDRLEGDPWGLGSYTPVYQRGIEKDFNLWNWFEIQDTYSYLTKQGAVRLLDPAPVVREHSELLAYALASDLLMGTSADAGIAPLLLDPGYEPKWILHEDRFPGHLSELAAADAFWAAVSTAALDYESGYPADLCRTRLNQTVDAIGMARDRKVQVSYEVAYSLILSQALLLCDEYSLLPVTDDGAVHAAFLRKCEKLYSGHRSRKVIIDETAADSDRISLFGLNVLGRTIPDAALALLTVQEILAYREDNRDSLAAFWARMTELTASCDEIQSPDAFAVQVRKIIETKVIPETNALQEALRESSRRLFGRPIVQLVAEAAKAAGPSIPTISLATLYGLTPGQIAAMGVSSLLAGIGMVLPGIFEDITARSQLSKSAFSYLLNVPKDPGGRVVSPWRNRSI
jgi:hypothetical protein